ncbi:LytR/AlgR family response regulator transcription factor [Flavobacterium sp.]|jgi:DNA-binding LytR/AlgR family response regulator|uniref:LytR/AlgR family response regulator transcription factor n=1 Tax=Flavobacterium sp. TaxID=239 RepID=UPI0037BFFECD
MRFSFLIIDDKDTTVKETLELFENFPNYFCAGIVKDSQTALKQIIKLKPQLVMVQIPVKSNDANLFFETIKESFQYIDSMPYFIVLAPTPDYALTAIQSGFSDYSIMPLQIQQLGKSLFRFEKRNQGPIVSTICIKSHSDYKFVPLQDILYLKADNNTTDIKLLNNSNNGNNGDNNIVNAFKTLKHFENILPFYFLRIHKSYIVNINYVSRIYLSKSKCYLNYDEPLPFSLTYKENVDAIIRKINI